MSQGEVPLPSRKSEKLDLDIISCRQLGPHSIYTWAGYRHWQNKNAWLSKRTPEGGLSPAKRGQAEI